MNYREPVHMPMIMPDPRDAEMLPTGWCERCEDRKGSHVVGELLLCHDCIADLADSCPECGGNAQFLDGDYKEQCECCEKYRRAM